MQSSLSLLPPSSRDLRSRYVPIATRNEESKQRMKKKMLGFSSSVTSSLSLSLSIKSNYGAQYAWLPPPVDLRFFSLKGPRVDIDRSCARTRNPSLLFSVPIPFLVIFFVRLAATNLLIEKILFQIFLILKSRITYHRNKLEKFYNNNSGQRNSFKLVSFPMEDKFM